MVGKACLSHAERLIRSACLIERMLNADELADQCESRHIGESERRQKEFKFDYGET